jgi:hypothetical protein
VEVVYEVMEKFIRKLREEEGAQKLGLTGEHMSPGQALVQLRKWMNQRPGGNRARLEDPDPEFNHKVQVVEEEKKESNSHESLAELLRSGIQSSSSFKQAAALSSMVPQLASFQSDEGQASFLKEAITRSSSLSLLEVSSQVTTQTRPMTENFLRFYNIMMWWCAKIAMDKDDKTGMALLELESSVGSPQRPSSIEADPPTWADVMEARRQACDHNSCIHGSADEDLEYHRKVAVHIEHEAQHRGFGPIKHLPAPGGVEHAQEDGWSLATTLEMAKSVKETSWKAWGGPMRPVAAAADCGPFFRKAISEMVVLAWMTWWSMYYTILSWLKTDTNKAE